MVLYYLSLLTVERVLPLGILTKVKDVKAKREGSAFSATLFEYFSLLSEVVTEDFETADIRIGEAQSFLLPIKQKAELLLGFVIPPIFDTKYGIFLYQRPQLVEVLSRI